MSSRDRPVVLHYREAWLGTSETFIHETASRHARYAPVVLTHARVHADAFPAPGPLHVAPDPSGPGAVLEWSALLRIRRRRRAVARALDALRPDLIHAHFGEEGVTAAPAAGASGIPLVVTFYGFDATHLAAHALWRRRFRALFARAALVLAEGPALRDRLISLGAAPERARVHPIPVRLERFPFEPRQRPEDGRVVLLQACRFAEKKGVDLTIRAFAQLAADWPRAELWLLGGGPEQPSIERLVRETGFGDRIRLLGMRPHAEYAEVLRAAHVFVQPSRTAANGDGEGGAPTTLLEAQALGMPVVASTHADIPYVTAEDGALLARENDAGAVAAHIRHLLDHPDQWPARARAGRELVERQHDPGRLAAELEALYDEARGVATAANAAALAPGRG